MELQDSDGEFDWDNITQGYLLGAMFYGYLIGNMIGGPCVDMFGSKMIMAISMFFSGVTQIVSPWLAEYGANFLLLCQILFGAVQVRSSDYS